MTALRLNPLFKLHQNPLALHPKSAKLARKRAVASLVESLESRTLLSAITGTVYMDSNNNGMLDADEPGIDQITIILTKAVTGDFVAFATTQNGGSYEFTDLAAGSYVVSEIPSDLYLDTIDRSDNDPNNQRIDLPADTVKTDVNFGNLLPSSLSGYVYDDANDNGIMDPGEQPIPGVLISLNGTDDQNFVWQMAFTKADGSYSFTNLRPGSYTLSEEQPADYLDGQDTVGTQGGVADNDAITSITLAVGTDGLDNNFGEHAPVPPPVDPPPPPPPPPPVITTASLSGRVLTDLTGDGLTADDTALAGVKVKLFLDRNDNGILDDADDDPVAIAITDPATGAYSFTDLQPGRYFVKQSKPAGYVPTAPILDSYYTIDAAADSNATNLDFANFKKPDRSAITKVSYVINGKETVKNLRNKVHAGDWVQVSFTVRPGHSVTLSLVSYTAPNSKFVAAEAGQQQVYQSQTQTFGPGKYKLALGVYVPKTNFQIDFVIGSVIPQFGPAKSNIFYSSQHRLISTDNGGPTASPAKRLASPIKHLASPIKRHF